ncbi:hypothetical protein [Romboutsia ilealis]|uniref:hypothetical protein n=1 Tax=Romboutsia ilealis TaxID=1115758 RepID=UPI00272CFD7D|nr:hypothetical protein [Romboutsia ilealis]
MFICKICREKYKSLEGLYSHIEEEHEELIPKDMSVEQYYYFMKTGKSHGNCVMCKGATKWNESTQKYHRFCSNPKCKEKYKEEFKKRMIGKHGKVHLLNDPEQQKKMLANRSISGEYTWSNNIHKIQYTGSYELDFLKNMDLFFNWDPEDIIMPSPHTYYYEYEGQEKFYIPDVFIPSLGLEIEIKDGGDNPNNHHKIQAVDKVKEKKKDDVLTSQKSFHYIKIINKNYSNLIVFLHEMKSEFEKFGDMDKIPRKFYTEDVHSKVKLESVNKGVELIQESTNIDLDNLETVEEGTISFTFIKDLILTKRMKYDGDNYFKELDNFKYEYHKLIRSCSSIQEIEIIKKDIKNLKIFLKQMVDMGDQRYVNLTTIKDINTWVKYDVAYAIEKREQELSRRNNFVGDIKDRPSGIEVIVLFDRSKNRTNKFFTLLDKDSKVIFNKTHVLDRSNNIEAFIDKSDLDNKECMVYIVKKDIKTDNKVNNPKPISRMFDAKTSENNEFVCDAIKSMYNVQVKQDEVEFVYSGTYKKYIEGGVK